MATFIILRHHFTILVTVFSKPDNLTNDIIISLRAHHKTKMPYDHLISENTIKGGCHINPKMPKKHWASISGKNLNLITFN